MEDDVDVWHYAMLELHARNDDDDFLLVGHCKYSCMLYHSSYLPLNIHDVEKVTEGYSNWYHSKPWVRFPICLPTMRY